MERQDILLENLLPKNTNSDVNYMTSSWIRMIPPIEGADLEYGLPIVHKFTSNNNKLDRELGYKAIDHAKLLIVDTASGTSEYINTSKYLKAESIKTITKTGKSNEIQHTITPFLKKTT